MFLRDILLGSVALVLSASPAFALSLQGAVKRAVETNPEIGQAIENREATEFELKQVLGTYLPRLDLEASTGVNYLSNPSRRSSGIDDDPLYPSQVGLTLTYDIYDGGGREARANQQAAHVDSASFKVLDSSQNIALQIAREYFEVILQARIVDIAGQNVGFHATTLSNVNDAIARGQLTAAERQQATERLSSAKARLIEAQQALEEARISFNRMVGVPLSDPSLPPAADAALPKSLSLALEIARRNNPRVLSAGADIDAASAAVDEVQGGAGPKIALEASAKTGLDTGGTSGATTDMQGRLVMRWSIFDGGTQNARVQENIRRESAAMMALRQTHGEVEEAVRVSWDRIGRQRELAAEYGTQLTASQDLVTSYEQQFGVGQRSLLDVLGAQNTRFDVQVLRETADFGARFAQYRLLASTGQLLAFFKVAGPGQADAYARKLMDTPSASEAKPRKRETVDLTGFVN